MISTILKFSAQVDQYGEDGAGTTKGFGVYETTDIPAAGTSFLMVYRDLVPIPNGKQMSLMNGWLKSNWPYHPNVKNLSQGLNFKICGKKTQWQSNLQCLSFKTDPSQNFSSIFLRGRECNLAGPLQFVNHSCTEWNSQYVSGPGKKFLYLKVY